MRVNGLYGHVRSNDARSIALFTAFVAAFHVLAMLALLVPLATFDLDHAPLYNWTGYLVRWVPIVTVIGALLFVVQMAWHVRTVHRRTDFRFVDDQDEPRLCRIVEPLAIAAGVPTPYVGVINSPALNAFACGIRQRDAVLVFTRGLIDGLDDDELAAVAAHEIIHIKNGDIRLIAATNVCLDTLRLLQPRPPADRMKRIYQACTMPMVAVVMPLMLVLVLVTMFVRRLAVDGSHLARLLIASAREFVADAEAVRLTQNPAALVSALQHIEGRSHIPGMAAGQDAMMIDGAQEGAFATHPTIAQRISAIISVTGSIAVIAPNRRDTRSAGQQARGGSGRRVAPALEAAFTKLSRQSTVAGLERVHATEFNRLGLTPELTMGAIAAIGVFLFEYRTDLGNPSALAAAFDPAPMRTYFAMSREGLRCNVQGLGWTFGLTSKPQACGLHDMLAGHHGESGIFGKIADALPEVGVENSSGVTTYADGTFGNVPRPEPKLGEVPRARCFQTEPYSVGDRGLHSVTERPGDGETISLLRYLNLSDDAAKRATKASPAARDTALLDYFQSREVIGEVVHRFFGNAGLDAAAARYNGSEHRDAIALLRQRLADPSFASGLSPLKRAELELLASAPSDFVSCVARRSQGRAKT